MSDFLQKILGRKQKDQDQSKIEQLLNDEDLIAALTRLRDQERERRKFAQSFIPDRKKKIQEEQAKRAKVEAMIEDAKRGGTPFEDLEKKQLAEQGFTNVKMVFCETCEHLMPADEFFRHREECKANASAVCPFCKKAIKLKDFKSHVASCGGG